MSHSFNTLNNEEYILDLLEKTLGKKLSNLCLKRNSYINRVYEIEILNSQERLIVKFYRPGRWTREQILEEHQFLKELHQSEIRVIPPMAFNQQTLFEDKDLMYSFFPKKGGRALDEYSPEGWQELGRLTARIHQVGAKHQASRRIQWKPSIATRGHLQTLLHSQVLPAEFESVIQKTIETFIQKWDAYFETGMILIHGDSHRGNLIHRPGEGIFIIDFDDLCLGPAIQDFWMHLPDLPEKCELEIENYQKGYTSFRNFDEQELELIPALRGMRLIHFASWCAVQKNEIHFQEHFPNFGSPHYWNEWLSQLQQSLSFTA